MKKTILAIAIMSIFLISCGTSTTTESKNTTDSCNVSVDSLCCDTTKCDTTCIDTLRK